MRRITDGDYTTEEMPPFVISDRLYKVGVEFLAMFFLPVVISLIDRYYELVRILQKMCQ